MINTAILSWVTFIYFAAFAFYLVRMVSGREIWGRMGTAAASVGLLAQTVALILRWVASYEMGIGHAPLTNLYESLIFFAWAIVALYLTIEWRTKNRSLGAFVVPVAFLCMAFASLSPGINSRIQPLIPALQSNWLTSHVLTCFLGYAAFTVAFALGLMVLLKARDGNPGEGVPRFLRLIPDMDSLDELIYQSTVLGFVFLTIGIMTGSVWAHYAWGSYWSWDPKETWSLITWLVYAIMLHSRYVRGWRGKRMAVMAIIGFISVLITYLGVNYLPGLHSYQ
ncbi:MAG: Cytochrome c biogenesis protein CcsA [Syntrophaceae bacterium PtaB.Bin095]|mgnify:CR=1 FL=1|jgi:cytochrome c-type biogenesis protein CcsB|nr:MAG: Cytochrome c biogenesis protein CcsA [Syntrophaceae bacterium PtaB.Bin095]